MVQIKFKKAIRKNIFQPTKVISVSFRTPTTLGRTLIGRQQDAKRYVISMKKVNKPTSLWNPSMNRPGAAFWGDSDGDGVYNGLDCEPHNPKKQGSQHRNNSWEQYGESYEDHDDDEPNLIENESKREIENKKISDFGVAFNKGMREKFKAKEKSTKSDSDDAQSLIDLS